MKFEGKWEKVSTDVECSPFPTNYVYDGIALKSQEFYNFATDNIAFCYFDNKVEYWFYDNSYSKIGKIFLKRFLETDFLKETESKHFLIEKKAINLKEKIQKTNLKDIPNTELSNLYKEYYNLVVDLFVYSYPLSSMELDIPLVTNKLLTILKSKNTDISLPEITTPKHKTIFAQAKEDFLNLVIKNNKTSFNKFLNKYYWLHYGHEGNIITKNELQEMINNYSTNAKKELEDLNKKPKIKISFSQEEEKVINLARQVVYLKSVRKYLLFKIAADFRPVFEQIASRLSISFKDLMYLHYKDVRLALIKGLPISNLIKERKKGCIFLKFDNKEKEFNGNEAIKFNKELQKYANKSKHFTGTTAMVGHTKGYAKIIKDSSDMHKLNQGDILVSFATNPNLVPIMGKASAILTEEGGLTCHAAIFAREFKIPCIVGIKNIMTTLNDNDLIEVNANQGEIKIISKKE